MLAQARVPTRLVRFARSGRMTNRRSSLNRAAVALVGELIPLCLFVSVPWAVGWPLFGEVSIRARIGA